MSIKDQQAETESLAKDEARHEAFRHLSRLLQIVPKPRWATPVLLLLGLASSFAETLGIALIIMLFYTLMGESLSNASVTGFLGDAFSYADSLFNSSLQMAIVLLLLIVLRGALSYANNMISVFVSEQINEKVRNLIHEQYLTVSYRFMQQHEQAKLMEVLGNESWFISNAYVGQTKILISGCYILVFTLALLMLSWQIMLVAMLGYLLVSFALRRLSAPAQAIGREVKQVHEKLGELMLVTLEGLRTIRAYGQENAHHERFLQTSAKARDVSISMTRLTALLNPLTEVGYLVILSVIIAWSMLFDIGFVTALAAVIIMYRLQPYTRSLEGCLLYMAQIEPQLRSVRMMLEKDDKEYPPQGHLPLTSFSQRIRFDQVTFQYEPHSEPALKNVSFDIPIGQTTALIGASGAGKTTIINLLLGLYQPTSGRIWIDDTPLDQLRREDWIQLLGVSGQDVDLIEGTVIDNIQMANMQASMDEIEEASKIAGVSEFINTLPEGYHTWIGQQGHRFSGGQRQRIGLARAILRNPKFLILDEAMSALDIELEEKIRNAINERFSDRTLLMITHRVDTVVDANQLIRIVNGAIVD